MAEILRRASALRPKRPILISAMTDEGLIGCAEGLPWFLPEEYDHYLELVRGQIVLMGRKSYEIFGRDLKTSHNLVLSRTIRALPGAQVFGCLNDALAAADVLPGVLFSAGGREVYQQTINLADNMLLSYVHGSYMGDVYFPAFDRREWVEAERASGVPFDFVIFQRHLSA